MLGADDGSAVYRQLNQPEAGGVVYAVQHGDQFVYLHHGPAPYRVAAFGLAAAPPPRMREDQGPSWLLAARHEVVTFAGRTRELRDLRAWRDTAGSRVSVCLVHGPGGQGKTRLAAHFAQESAAAGWTAATALHRSDPMALAAVAGGRQEELRVGRQGLLLVVDYAERWPAGDLLAAIVDHQATAGRVRVLLLARPAGIWWSDLAYRLECFGITEAGQLPLTALAARPQERASLFTDAAAAFAQHLGVPSLAPPAAPRDLQHHSAYGLVLTVHMAALAAVDASRRGQSPPPDAVGLSRYLLKRERGYWAVLHKASQITTTPAVMSHIVYTATVTRALGHDDAVAALNRVGVASDPASATVTLADHALCYPPADPATVLEPLYPDQLAEDFLALSTPGHEIEYPADAWAATAAARLLAPAPDGTVPRWTRAGLAILIETAARWPHIASRVLYPLLAADPPLALIAGGAALTRLADLPDIDLALLEAIEAHLPSGRHVDLDPAAAVITTRLHAHRLASATDDHQRARLHATLGNRLASASRPEEALIAIGEAAEIFRRLAAGRPAAFEPGLATSLTNLSADLLGLGRPEEALAAAEEATDIHRRLATARPDAFEPDLATLLANLLAAMSRLARPEEDLAPAEEAAEIRRGLAAAFEPDLAGSLTNLSAILSELGRREEALAATEEATDIYRRLAAARPDAFEPGLATSLNNLSVIWLGLGRGEALAAAKEAVEIERRLAAARPAAFEPDLATSLGNLGLMLSGLGRREEALAAGREAAEIRRRLAAAWPAAFEPDLARSLTNLPALLGLGRREEALTAAAEAAEIYRRLAAARPAAFEPGLATSLGNLGLMLSGFGRWEEALAATEEAADIYRRLAAARPDAFEPDLARSLRGYAWVRAAGKADLGHALTAAEEAVTRYEALASRRPSAFTNDLAGALAALAGVLDGLDRAEAAAAARRRAEELGAT
jgi:tetratricopeptide (TPR) repeat protein